MKILAVDDDQLVLLPLQKKIQELGYKVMIADNAKKGIELFDSFKPHLVIVDMNMPETSGFEFIEHLRVNKRSSTPIIVLSGYNNTEIISETFKLGINDYIIKSNNFDDLHSRIKRVNIFFQIQ
ncbi:response regulator [Jejuia pallidilutea]|uniref:Dolichyl phosphate glucosyltransferase n=1 Tax=Jejuia pallidilutea TaxID=504487 RepID=A0A090W7X4_9FLAO|nr:response regulator [Jejuia pallidilutea]GAL65905.1 dolichyl phosphate glucosyltransferase [Jejuia pallidilutea]GAL71544.1 dolichyl phosphate glucosyltransferase [Jejuia pallidilutea]GAL88462.1 dolichyl phosphate glucosyltransferase [Jejuia pallidilutea]